MPCNSLTRGQFLLIKSSYRFKLKTFTNIVLTLDLFGHKPFCTMFTKRFPRFHKESLCGQ